MAGTFDIETGDCTVEIDLGSASEIVSIEASAGRVREVGVSVGRAGEVEVGITGEDRQRAAGRTPRRSDIEAFCRLVHVGEDPLAVEQRLAQVDAGLGAHRTRGARVTVHDDADRAKAARTHHGRKHTTLGESGLAEGGERRLDAARSRLGGRRVGVHRL